MYGIEYWVGGPSGSFHSKFGFASSEEAEEFRLAERPSCAYWFILKQDAAGQYVRLEK